MARTNDVFIVADHLITPLANGTDANFERLSAGLGSVRRHEELFGLNGPFHASVFDDREDHAGAEGLTRFEHLLVDAGRELIGRMGIDPSREDLRIVVASAKGNIHLAGRGDIDPETVDRISMHRSARLVANRLGVRTTPLVISNACISGLLALIEGSMLIRSGACRHVLVLAADILSDFILSGFRSLMALSAGVCRPFDAARDGINLGEAAAAAWLTSDAGLAGKDAIRIHPGAVTNDANHISGPSRTGEELALAMRRAMDAAGKTPADIDFISGHGTATLYNDEMESKAIMLAGLNHVPANSLKAYYGHTLGAAGLLESIVSMMSLRDGMLLPTLGFETPGVTTPVNICQERIHGNFTQFLKTASGFGGCNAAAVFSKT